MLMVTFIGTLILGIQQGVLVGVVLSLAMFVFANSRPHFAVLGRLSDSSHFRNIERFPNANCPRPLVGRSLSMRNSTSVMSLTSGTR